MKSFILKITLYVMRTCMCFIYFFIKLFPRQNNKLLMISRQSNEISIDFEMLKDEIVKKHKDINIKILCKKIPDNFIGKVGYCFYIIKCMYHISTSKVCIVDGYVIPVSVLKHKKGIIIVQIWHAMGAIKKFGKQVLDKNEGSKAIVADIMKMHKNYTFVTCTSESTKEFYSEAFGVEKEKILILGMPRVDYLLGKDNKINDKINKLVEKYPNLKEKKTILYVPTFRKGKSAHIYDVINAVNSEKYNLIIRLHPLDNTKVEEKYLISSKYSTFELLKIADYVITDYSALGIESAALEKPTFFYLYDIEEYNISRGMNVNLQEEMKNSTFKDIHEITNLIENNEYDYEELLKFKAKYIQTADTKNSERIINYIIKLMEGKNGEKE